MEGWVKLHRKLIENPIFLKPDLLQLFIYCLLKANHEPNKIIFNGKEIIIERGQFITGREVLAKDLNQNGRSTYDRLKVLENLQILNIKSNNRFTLVTIVNYTFYQIEEQKSNNKSNNKPTTSQQQANTNKNDKNDKEDIYTPAIDYLNLKAGTKFKASTEKTKTLISSRLNEGFTIDDFKRVIDIKVKEWIGSEWEKFLRPETLFGNKFESYLNQKPSTKQQPQQGKKATEQDMSNYSY